MKKVAVVGQIHQAGSILTQSEDLKVFEIKDFSQDNLKRELFDVDAVALRTTIIDENILKECPKIKIISRHGVGYDNITNYLNNHKDIVSVIYPSLWARIIRFIIERKI